MHFLLPGQVNSKYNVCWAEPHRKMWRRGINNESNKEVSRPTHQMIFLAWFRERFRERLISRMCDVELAPHILDLNPALCICGSTSRIMCTRTTKKVNKLKAAITAKIREIPKEECARVTDNCSGRVQVCLQRRGPIWNIFWIEHDFNI